MTENISSYIKKSRSIKEKFQLFVLLSSCIIAIMLVTGAYKHFSFYEHRDKVESNSKELLENLTINFENTALMAEIQSDFTSFTQTAHPEKMQDLIKKSHKLLEQLPKEANPALVQFLNQAGKLEIRMTSLRNNNLIALGAGNKILTHLQQINHCEGQAKCIQAANDAATTYLNFHPLYITSILNGQKNNLTNASKQISHNFEQTIDNLYKATETLPTKATLYLSKLRDMFMDLDDAVTTVSAIKIKVLTTEEVAIQTLKQINTILNKQSLSQQETAVGLSREGLIIARDAGLQMIFTLLIFTFLIIIIGGFISRGVINPLISLVKLLENFSKLLSNIRTQNVSDNEQHAILHSTIANRPDEIGDVAHATMDLMNHMRSISEFRKKIEDDLATDDVYFRLSTIFTTQLHLRSFVFYEVDKLDAMTPVFIQPHGLADYLPDLTVSSMCRAKRTGAMVSSLSDPEICRICPYSDALDHICIPMLAGGQVMGVVQLLAPISLNRQTTDEFNQALEIAQNYIEEALPVIQAKRFARELEEMATKDQLTGLYNRRYLEISLQQIIAGIKRRGTKLGILMCDMDFFKQVNDSHGHDAGDIVLTKLSAILLENVRAADLVIRFGGEEFLILLLDIEEDQIIKVAEKIRSAVESYTFQLPGNDIQKTLSIGTAVFPSAGTNGIWEVIKQADVALYNAKDGGRNQVVEFNTELWKEQSY